MCCGTDGGGAGLVLSCVVATQLTNILLCYIMLMSVYHASVFTVIFQYCASFNMLLFYQPFFHRVNELVSVSLL